MKVPTIFHYSETVPPHCSTFHVVRHHFKSRAWFVLHGHADYAEIFWVESGAGTHLIQGTRQPLKEGSLVLVRPQDVHGFQTGKDEAFTLVNLSFPLAVLKEWEQRYFPRKPIFFWTKAKLPHTQEMDSAQIQRLRKWTEYLSTCPNRRFHLDWFLMDFFHSLLPHRHLDEGRSSLPGPLAKALVQIREPQHFSEGPRRLAKLAGYSLQHLNRILKKYKEPTAGEHVNEARLDYAARQLQLSSDKILQICLECGFSNLGHFYLLFKKRFGVTPRKFRLRQQLVIGKRTEN